MFRQYDGAVIDFCFLWRLYFHFMKSLPSLAEIPNILYICFIGIVVYYLQRGLRIELESCVHMEFNIYTIYIQYNRIYNITNIISMLYVLYRKTYHVLKYLLLCSAAVWMHLLRSSFKLFKLCEQLQWPWWLASVLMLL